MAATRLIEHTAIIIIISAILVSFSWLQAMAESNCQSSLSELSPCYGYATGNVTTPSTQCCNKFRDVLESQPTCLCQIVSNNSFNQTRVLALPSACNVQTPPVSYCYSPLGSPTPPGSRPSSSGYSTTISCSLLVTIVLAAASCAGNFITI